MRWRAVWKSAVITGTRSKSDGGLRGVVHSLVAWYEGKIVEAGAGDSLAFGRCIAMRIEFVLQSASKLRFFICSERCSLHFYLSSRQHSVPLSSSNGT